MGQHPHSTGKSWNSTNLNPIPISYTFVIGMPGQNSAFLPAYLNSFLIVMEIVRRSGWLVLRLENEQLRNTLVSHLLPFVPRGGGLVHVIHLTMSLWYDSFRASAVWM